MSKLAQTGRHILKPGVHIIATIATIAQKELSDETVRSAIATIAIAEIENVVSRRSRQSQISG